jgi:hypothetical protein
LEKWLSPQQELNYKEKSSTKESMECFVGYAPNHAPDVYWILKMANRRIVMSRGDLRWLKKHYYQWSQGQDDIDDEEMATIEQIEMETEGDENTQDTIVPTEVIENNNPVADALSTNVASRPPSENVKLIRAMSKLDTFFNPDASKAKTTVTHPER